MVRIEIGSCAAVQSDKAGAGAHRDVRSVVRACARNRHVGEAMHTAAPIYDFPSPLQPPGTRFS